MPPDALAPRNESRLAKEMALRGHDLAMMATATNYDLGDKRERKRSASDLARFFLRASKAIDVDLFIEAGAKEASSSRRATKFLDDARIVAFEANPLTYEEFRGVNDPSTGIEYLHLALSSEPGEVTFHVRQNADGSLRPDGHGSLMARTDDCRDTYEEVRVQATTLDTFFAGHDYDQCAMWVDVEGGVKDVFAGGTATLDKAAVMIIEVEDTPLWKGAWTYPEVASFLYDRRLVPIARDYEYRRQYNVVFVREDLLHDDMLRLRLTQHLSSTRGSKATPG